MKMSEERKEYLKAYKTTVKRIPLEVSYPFYILLMEHMWKYGDIKHTNSYIKSRLQFAMDMEDAGIMDRVKAELEARKRTGAFKKN